MRARSLLALTGLAASASLSAPGRAAGTAQAPATPVTPSVEDVSIPFTKTTLPNGMTVILSEDHALPVVAVNVTYDVGSRFEEAHRTGFAHLFEHLMFLPTRRAPRGIDVIEDYGGFSNAWTSEDRTDYSDLGPASILDLTLWLEADRMRDLGPLMTQEKLDPEREVVRNERRQDTENTPYGLLELRVPALLYPEGHPYHHATIGSHEDLEAAQVADVKAFFSTYYDPANASLCVAGDFDPKETMDRIVAWFGTLASKGKPVDPSAALLARARGADAPLTTLTSVVRETDEDDVEFAKTTMEWQAPRHFAKGDAELELLANVLAEGRESRLYKALVYDQRLAQDVSAEEEGGVLSSRFEIQATARPGISLDKLEAAVDAELTKVRKVPLTAEELTRAKAAIESRFIERLQAPGARASILNDYQAEVGDPGFAQRDLERYGQVTADIIRDTAARVLDPSARVIVRVVPRKEKLGTSEPSVKPSVKK
jgi:predicted Zn-dependent peptidase